MAIVLFIAALVFSNILVIEFGLLFGVIDRFKHSKKGIAIVFIILMIIGIPVLIFFGALGWAIVTEFLM